MKKTTRKQLRQDNVHIHEEVPEKPEETSGIEEEYFEDGDDEFDSFSEPTEKDTHQTNRYLRRRQQEFRRAAEAVAEELVKLSAVQKVVLFGSVAMPLQKEVPRFREYHCERIACIREKHRSV